MNKIINYVLAVHELGSFSQAAKRCFVSQPALSMQIKSLEEQLKVKLFKRNNKKVITTATGEQIINHFYQMRHHWLHIQNIAQEIDPLIKEIKVGIFPTLAPYLLPKIIEPLSRLEGIKYFFVEEKTAVLIDKLFKGQIDCAILAEHTIPNTSKIDLFDDPFYLAVYSEHALANKKTISLEDINSHDILLLEEGHCLRDQTIDLCKIIRNRIHPFKATSLETARYMTIAKNTITFIPKIAIKDDGLVYVPFDNSNIKRSLRLFFPKNQHKYQFFQFVAKAITHHYHFAN